MIAAIRARRPQMRTRVNLEDTIRSPPHQDLSFPIRLNTPVTAERFSLNTSIIRNSLIYRSIRRLNTMGTAHVFAVTGCIHFSGTGMTAGVTVPPGVHSVGGKEQEDRI
jgi:hypothetical protein